MKMRNLLVFFILTYSLQQNILAQDLFFIGKKSYSSTGFFSLKVGSGFTSSGTLDCLVARNGEAGYFVVSRRTTTGSVISENITIYLEDGTIIDLSDRGKRDFVDGASINAYTLRASEITKLKNSVINTIRFTMKCQGSPCNNSEDGSFTAKNMASSSYLGNSKDARANSVKLVTELFK
jgi:hypothetical protein